MRVERKALLAALLLILAGCGDPPLAQRETGADKQEIPVLGETVIRYTNGNFATKATLLDVPAGYCVVTTQGYVSCWRKN